MGDIRRVADIQHNQTSAEICDIGHVAHNLNTGCLPHYVKDSELGDADGGKFYGQTTGTQIRHVHKELFITFHCGVAADFDVNRRHGFSGRNHAGTTDRRKITAGHSCVGYCREIKRHIFGSRVVQRHVEREHGWAAVTFGHADIPNADRRRVVVGDRCSRRICRTRDVTGAGINGQHDRFIQFHCGVRSRIDSDGGRGIAVGKSHHTRIARHRRTGHRVVCIEGRVSAKREVDRQGARRLVTRERVLKVTGPVLGNATRRGSHGNLASEFPVHNLRLLQIRQAVEQPVGFYVCVAVKHRVPDIRGIGSNTKQSHKGHDNLRFSRLQSQVVIETRVVVSIDKL